MTNVTELTINAMFYVYFVVLSGGLAIVTSGFVGLKVYNRQQAKKARKDAVKGQKKRLEGRV